MLECTGLPTHNQLDRKTSGCDGYLDGRVLLPWSDAQNGYVYCSMTSSAATSNIGEIGTMEPHKEEKEISIFLK